MMKNHTLSKGLTFGVLLVVICGILSLAQLSCLEQCFPAEFLLMLINAAIIILMIYGFTSWNTSAYSALVVIMVLISLNIDTGWFWGTNTMIPHLYLPASACYVGILYLIGRSVRGIFMRTAADNEELLKQKEEDFICLIILITYAICWTLVHLAFF